jgi:predicted ABC-class ATPase
MIVTGVAELPRLLSLLDTMSTLPQLRQQLLGLDGQSYGAYKSMKGTYRAEGFSIGIDFVQGDPFASPSTCHVLVDAAFAAIPEGLFRNEVRAIALEDFLLRQFYREAQHFSRDRGMGHSGEISTAQPSQAVLERSAAFVDTTGDVTMRFRVGLPAQGRRILGRQAAEMLCEDVPMLVERALRFRNLDGAALRLQVETVEDTEALRQQLDGKGLVAFIPDGALLARQSGVNEKPLVGGHPWRSPAELRVSLTCPNRGEVTGTGINKGVTLIVGGGYHGKSTLLNAIEHGVYNHVPGDGREYLVTDPSAVKIRAEDGRSIVRVNLSPFINHLPNGESTTAFSSTNASGSTSQAANILEAIEAGTRTLLIDEDTSATNFMIRDRRMQALIAKHREPITPFVERVRQLADEHQVSTILVMGGSGDYFEVADTVLAMDEYQAQEVTEQAKAIAETYRNDRLSEATGAFGSLTSRAPTLSISPVEDDRPRRGRGGFGRGERLNLDRSGPDRFNTSADNSNANNANSEPEPERRTKQKTRGLDAIVLDQEEIALDAVEQLAESGQLKAIAAALVFLRPHLLGKEPIAKLLDRVERHLEVEGLEGLNDRPPVDFVMFRRQELAAALNRWRSIQ